jgi:hypothetical protein
MTTNKNSPGNRGNLSCISGGIGEKDRAGFE